MRRIVSLGAVVMVGILGVACGGTPKLPPAPPAPSPVEPPKPLEPSSPAAPRGDTPDAAFREKAPDEDGTVVFTPPKVESFRLKNGVRVLFVERRDLPIVSVRLALKAGAGDYPALKPGVASFMGSMLEQGTKSRTALQLSDDYEEIGAQHAAWCGWDSCGGSVKTLAKHLDRALQLLADVATHPTFPDAEIERLRSRRLAALAQEKTQPGAMSQNAVAAALYGRNHPYGNALGGRADDVKALARKDLVKAYETMFTPKNATLVVAGDITQKALADKLESSFGAWAAAGAAQAPRTPAAPATSKAPRLVLVDKPGAAQSQVALVEVGVPRRNADRDAITVMNSILGGIFSSRINLNLREANHFTYGAGSRFAMRHGPGPFLAGGAMVSEKTAAAVGELFREIRRMIDEDVKDEELADAKSDIKHGLPGRFETVNAVTSAVEDIAIYDLPLDEFVTLPKRIDAVTVKDVRRVAKKYLHPEALKVVIVGDRAKLESELTQTLRLGAPEGRDAYGDLVQ
ncbi:insulinase family protein [Pendulispora brunnea]|uniref:Insulinase family protein n=1 Tax=Pendulispora brunnea TaxID=2905690 RepID=A0ABZ2KLQ1_9BACT